MKNNYCRLSEKEIRDLKVPDTVLGLLMSPFHFNLRDGYVMVPEDTFQQMTDVITDHVIQISSEAQLSTFDSDGKRVTEGDEIRFSYGIPPVTARGSVVVINGELWAMTPGHNPDRCRMAELRDAVELFYKV